MGAVLDPGSLLHERYRIVEILGQGGMGSVYRAVDENLGVDVAVKENIFTSDEYVRQFRMEAVILANLRHSNLPRVTDNFVISGQGQYLIMDYIEGEDLRQRMERLGHISQEDTILIGAAMCDALHYLHTRTPSVIHRDVKPGNVRITPDGHIYLVDFGLAKLVRGEQATTSGARAITPGYSPPEQYGTGRTDARTDIYSLGATLYAGLTGIIPEDGLARAMDGVELTPLRERNPRVSRRLATAIEKAMAVRPEDRFQSAIEFKQALASSNVKTQRLEGQLLITSSLPAADIAGNERLAQEVPPPVNPPQPPPASSKALKNRRRTGSRVTFPLFFFTVLAALLLIMFWPPVSNRILAFLTTATPTPTTLMATTMSEIAPIADFEMVDTPALTETLTPSKIPTETSTLSPTPVSTATSTLFPTRTLIPTETLWPTWTPSKTPTSTPTPSPTLTRTPALTATQIPSRTPIPTDTPWPTWTPTNTPTATSTTTSTQTPTATSTLTPTRTPIPTQTRWPTLTPTTST